MDNSNDSLDKLITETLNSIHSHALQDGLANSYRTLENIEAKKTRFSRQTKRYKASSLFAVAASFLLIVSLGIPALKSSQNGPSARKAKQIKSTDKVSTTVALSPGPGKDTSTTSNPLIVDPDHATPTTPTKRPLTQNTSPFISSPSQQPTPTTPAVVNQLARVSYSNTRANDKALDGAIISGNVYIFISDPDVYSALWFLDDGGKFEKGTHFRGGKTLPIDFNYRESDRLTPKAFDTTQWSVGEHTLGIQTLSNSTGKYSQIQIKFYVTR